MAAQVAQAVGVKAQLKYMAQGQSMGLQGQLIPAVVAVVEILTMALTMVVVVMVVQVLWFFVTPTLTTPQRLLQAPQLLLLLVDTGFTNLLALVQLHSNHGTFC
jgi:hypothetical protein